ncbi:MAG: hypothetical protein ACYC0F_18415, partial [Rhodanobacter sp.]
MDYTPSLIADVKTGEELDKEPFLLMDDAFPNLENAYLHRRKIKKKLGKSLLGRLRRDLTSKAIGNTGASPWSFNLFTVASISNSTAQSLVPGTVIITISTGPIVFTDNGLGVLSSVTPGNSGTINYASGAIVLTHTAGAGVATTATFSYYPCLPSMGLPQRELLGINADDSIAFDTKYAYVYDNSIQRYKETPSTLTTTWSGSDSDFFWSINAVGAIFTTNNVAGLQAYDVNRFQNAVVGPPSTIDVRTTATNSLQVGDQVIFINLSGAAAANNGLRGIVTIIIAPNEVTIQNIDGATWTNDAAVTTGNLIVATQNIVGDGIRWYDGVSWRNYNPPVTATTALLGGLILVYYRNRMVVLSSIEGNSNGGTLSQNSFRQRARWSQNGSPFAIGPLPSLNNIYGVDPNAWREDIPGRGGALDAPTEEQIVSAGFLKDTLIVFFERSTWRLRYTNNEIQPFQWERVNQDYGSESTFSTVLFDVGPITVGLRGIVQSDGVNTLRIDNLIP